MNYKIEKLNQIMRDFNQAAGFGTFPLEPKDLYFIMEMVNEMYQDYLKRKGT